MKSIFSSVFFISYLASTLLKSYFPRVAKWQSVMLVTVAALGLSLMRANSPKQSPDLSLETSTNHSKSSKASISSRFFFSYKDKCMCNLGSNMKTVSDFTNLIFFLGFGLSYDTSTPVKNGVD